MVSHARSHASQGRGKTNKRISGFGQLDFFAQLAQTDVVVGTVKTRIGSLVEMMTPVRFNVDLPSHLEDHFMEQMSKENIPYVRQGGQRFEITARTP